MFWKKKPQRQDIFTRIAPVIPQDVQVDIIEQDGHVLVTLTIDPTMARDAMHALETEVKQSVQEIKNVKSVQVVLTAEKIPEKKTEQKTEQKNTFNPDVHDIVSRDIAANVKHIIAVASGKGGVGKSTVAANLAVALAKNGLKVGLLDADIYGPSVPTLLGARHAKPEQHDDYLVPLEAHGIKIMSMGFLVDEEAPMVWRGPMVQSALVQMLRDVRWGTVDEPLDVLVLDMPPGTGDTQLTIAQKIKLSGAVIVSTPQDIALLDTVKGVNMFVKVAVPVLGIIQNMSIFCCPECGHQEHIFGHDGARKRAEELNIRFLGDIPLDMALRETSDQGVPAAAQDNHPMAQLFIGMAKNIYGLLQEKSGLQKPAPIITFDE